MQDTAARLTELAHPVLAKHTAALLALTFGVVHSLVLLFQPEGEGLLIQDGLVSQLDLLGQVVEFGKNTFAEFIFSSENPVIIDDLQTELRFPVPTALMASKLISGLCVRIPALNKAAGVLAIFSNKPRKFDQYDVARLSAVAGMLSVCMEPRLNNPGQSRAYAATLSAYPNQHLEELVRARTQELSIANQQLWSDIQEQIRIEENLRQAEHAMRSLSAELLSAQEQERRQIAADLHAGISQSLTAMKYSIEAAIGRGAFTSTGSNGGLIETTLARIQASIEEVQRLSSKLYPSVLDDLGIIPAIASFCREYQASHHHIRIDTDLKISERDVPANLRIVIYRIVQEALNFLAKQHHMTNNTSVHLNKRDSSIELVISDTGAGFDPELLFAPDKACDGVSVSSIRERAEFSGGTLSVNFEPETGSCIRVLWSVLA